MIVHYIGINDGFIKDKSISFHTANPFIKLVLMFLSCPYLLLHEKIYAKYILDYFFNVYEYLACIYVCVPHEYLVPIEDKRGCWILQGWSYRRF